MKSGWPSGTIFELGSSRTPRKYRAAFGRPAARRERPPPGGRPGGVPTPTYFFGFGGKSFSSFAIALSIFFCRFSGFAPVSSVLEA